MLSKDSEKILKMLREQNINYREQEVKEGETSKLSYGEIKDYFPEYSYISVILMLSYLLEERYIYNHIAGKEHVLDLEDLKSGLIELVIGDRGVAYLENKKYRLLAQIIPLSVAVISLVISVINLFMGYYVI